MKRLLIILVIIVVLVVGGLVYALTNLNSLAKRFLPEIERVASETLKTPVQIGDLEAHIFPQAKISLTKLSIGDKQKDPDGLALEEFQLGVDLLPLLKGKLSVHELALVGLKATAEKKGKQFVIVGLPNLTQQSKAKTPTTGEAKSKSAKEKKATPQKSNTTANSLPFAIALESVSLKGSTLRYKDKKAGIDQSITDLNLQSDISLNENIASLSSLRLDGTLDGKGPFSLEGTGISYDLTKGAGSVEKLVTKSDITTKGGNANANISIAQVAFTLQPLSVSLNSLTGEADYPNVGPLSFSIKDVSTSGQVMSIPTVELSGTRYKVSMLAATSVDIAKQSVQFELKKGSVTNNGQTVELTAKGSASPSDLRVEKYSIGAASGSSNGNALYSLHDNKPFHASVESKGLVIEELMQLATGDNKAQLRGTLSALSAQISGQTKAALQESLVGNASLELRDGEFMGGNLATEVLKSIKDLPFLEERLFETVPDEYKSQMDAETTPIKLLTSTIDVRSSSILPRSFHLESVLFNLDADGRIGFDQSLDLDATLRFNPVFSLALVEKTKELRGLMDENDRLVVPLQIKGKASKPIVLPNMKALLKTAAGEALKEKAGKLLGKALGEKGEKGNDTKNLVQGLGKAFGF